MSLSASVPYGTITAHDVVPEPAVVGSPATGAFVSASSALNVTWSSSTNPDRFLVFASWSCGSGCGTGKGFAASGAARSLVIPAGNLPAGTSVTLTVYSYNDGTETFAGPFEPGSRLAIRNGDGNGHTVTTTR